MQPGVRVTSVRYNKTIHDFVMLNPLAGTPATRGAIHQAIDVLKAALAGRNDVTLPGEQSRQVLADQRLPYLREALIAAQLASRASATRRIVCKSW